VQVLTEKLARCEQTRDRKIAEEVKKYNEESTTTLMDWNTELVAENERLKAELAKIRGEPNEPQSDATSKRQHNNRKLHKFCRYFGAACDFFSSSTLRY